MRRVVVTGLGVISPIGSGKEKFWDSLIKGKRGIQKARKINTDRYPTDHAAEVKDFDKIENLNLRKAGTITPLTKFILSATKMAIDDAGLKTPLLSQMGVVLGSNSADPLAFIKAIKFWGKHNYLETPPAIFRHIYTHSASTIIAQYFGLKGPCSTIPAACVAGNTTIAYAHQLIQMGHAQIMLAGGHSVINELTYAGFSKLRILAPLKCQPFDRHRKGLIIGEGAGLLVLEERQNALKRKAHIYAEISGYGLACDAHNIAMPHPEGRGGLLAVKSALKMARMSAKDIDYINAHGTGTRMNDQMETQVIRKIFTKTNRRVLVSSIKSMIGHCMGASSAIEACASVLVIERGIIPPNIEYATFDPKCDLNIVANQAIRKKVSVVMSNAFAFGGNSAIVIFSKPNKHV